MFISQYKLYLFPENPTESTPQCELVTHLKTVKFIDAEEETAGDSVLRYLSGEKFLSQVHFLGCSPDVEFHPDGDKPYIYIEIPEPTDTPQFISGINIKTPRCPQCKKELLTLPGQLKKHGTQIKMRCQHCREIINVHKINWRKTAFFCSSTIIINNIYESEAVPDDRFLSALEHATGFAWNHSYIRSGLFNASSFVQNTIESSYDG